MQKFIYKFLHIKIYFKSYYQRRGFLGFLGFIGFIALAINSRNPISPSGGAEEV
jgi:hypothetical protein